MAKGEVVKLLLIMECLAMSYYQILSQQLDTSIVKHAGAHIYTNVANALYNYVQ